MSDTNNSLHVMLCKVHGVDRLAIHLCGAIWIYWNVSTSSWREVKPKEWPETPAPRSHPEMQEALRAYEDAFNSRLSFSEK